MDAQILNSPGGVTFAVGVVILLFREILSQKVIPLITKRDGYKVVNTIIILAFILGLIMIVLPYLFPKPPPSSGNKILTVKVYLEGTLLSDWSDFTLLADIDGHDEVPKGAQVDNVVLFRKIPSKLFEEKRKVEFTLQSDKYILVTKEAILNAETLTIKVIKNPSSGTSLKPGSNGKPKGNTTAVLVNKTKKLQPKAKPTVYFENICNKTWNELITTYNTLKNYDEAKAFTEQLNRCIRYNNFSNSPNDVFYAVEAKPTLEERQLCSKKYAGSNLDISECLEMYAKRRIQFAKADITFTKDSIPEEVKDTLTSNNGVSSQTTYIIRSFTIKGAEPYGMNKLFTYRENIPTYFILLRQL